MVVTKQRSGSRWLVDNLAARSGNVALKAREMFCAGCSCGAPINASEAAAEGEAAVAGCAGTLRERYATLARRAQCDDSKRVGYKFMVPHSPQMPVGQRPPRWWHPTAASFEPLARAACREHVAVVFMWRRNVLRRLISEAANMLDGRRGGSHVAHPTTEAQVDRLRRVRPRLMPGPIRRDIQMEEDVRRAVEGAFRLLEGECEEARRAKVYYYEDLRDGAPRAEELWEDMCERLGIPLAPPGSEARVLAERAAHDYKVIHGSLPVLDTVGNPKMVRRALKGTRYEWMLYDGDPEDAGRQGEQGPAKPDSGAPSNSSAHH